MRYRLQLLYLIGALLFLTILFFGSNLSIIDQNEFVGYEMSRLKEINWSNWLLFFAPVIVLCSQMDESLRVQRAIRMSSKTRVVRQELASALMYAVFFSIIPLIYQAVRVMLLPGNVTGAICIVLFVSALQKLVFLSLILLLAKLGELFGINRFVSSFGMLILSIIVVTSYQLRHLADSFIFKQDYLEDFVKGAIVTIPVWQMLMWLLSLVIVGSLVLYFSNRWERI